MENREKPSFFSIAGMKNSLTLKFFMLGVVLLLMMFPVLLNGSLRSERAARAHAAEHEVSGKWGGPQHIAAPVLQIGLEYCVATKNGPIKKREILNLLPEKLNVTGSIAPEQRYRGIYPVLLYRSSLVLEGEFVVTLPRQVVAADRKIVPNDLTLQFEISDIKGISEFQLDFGGLKIKSVPGARNGNGIHCELPAEPVVSAMGKPIKFRAELALKGCRELMFQPLGSEFTMKLESPWPHPSFTGGFLPTARAIFEDGFVAEWKISELNRTYPQAFISGDTDRFTAENSVGVALVQVAGPYQQVERVNDYAILVIVIVLFAFLVGERLAKIWIHPLQYLFAGLSLVLFYTLLLAFSEHLNFGLSYVLSVLLIVALSTGYARAIFAGKNTPALLLGATVALSYALIYALVRMEDYALLAGSAILFVMLAVLMKFTGRINRQ